MVIALGAATLVASLPSFAQQQRKVSRIGLLTGGAPITDDSPFGSALIRGALTMLNRKRVFEFAAMHRLPAIYEYDFLVSDGGLMSYGPNLDELYGRASALTDRILKGTRPAELPIEQPTRFSFALNLKTAKALGIKFPNSILVRADKVIE